MKWAHLPNAGGLYEQDPRLLEGFELIFHERAEHEAREREKEKREQEKNKNKNNGKMPARRRR